MPDSKIIPFGRYCYDKNGVCPHWSTKPDLPEHENGFCAYLGKSDWDLNEEGGETVVYNMNGKVIGTEPAHSVPMSLLWDQCKECGINEEWNG